MRRNMSFYLRFYVNSPFLFKESYHINLFTYVRIGKSISNF